VLGFLKDDVLAATRPRARRGAWERTCRSARRSTPRAEDRRGVPGPAAVEATFRYTLGTTYLYLGETPLAIRQYERSLRLREEALGPDHLDTLRSRGDLAEPTAPPAAPPRRSR